jgi:hypothetical protein
VHGHLGQRIAFYVARSSGSTSRIAHLMQSAHQLQVLWLNGRESGRTSHPGSSASYAAFFSIHVRRGQGAATCVRSRRRTSATGTRSLPHPPRPGYAEFLVVTAVLPLHQAVSLSGTLLEWFLGGER